MEIKQIIVNSKAFGPQTILIDAADYNLVKSITWTITKIGQTFYAHNQNKGIRAYLHRFLMQPPKGMSVDHIDGNGLNNQRNNLRICTHSQNKKNNRRQSNNTSGYTGVSQVKGTSRFHAYIKCNRVRTTIGYFGSAIEAARAYNTKAKELFGQYARLNPIPDAN